MIQSPKGSGWCLFCVDARYGCFGSRDRPRPPLLFRWLFAVIVRRLLAFLHIHFPHVTVSYTRTPSHFFFLYFFKPLKSQLRALPRADRRVASSGPAVLSLPHRYAREAAGKEVVCACFLWGGVRIRCFIASFQKGGVFKI